MLRLFQPAPPPGMADNLRLMSDRLLLRPLSQGDAEAMYAYASDPEVTRYLPWTPAPDVESVRQFLREQMEKRRRGESLGLAIVLRQTGEMVGSTDLMDLRGSVRGRAELGYLLSRLYWGRGIMTEAARITAAHGFHALNLTRLAAFADADNAGSRRVLEKIGMRLAGTETRTVKDEERPYLCFEMTRQEFENFA